MAEFVFSPKMSVLAAPELKKYWDSFSASYAADHEREMITGSAISW
jgi:hypothetical protein